jgi:transposase-like protein
MAATNVQVKERGSIFGPHRAYLYRAIDQFGQVIDVLACEKRDLAATRRFFPRAREHGPRPR